MKGLTVYRAEGKDSGLVFLFKYDLNGDLRAFEIEAGVLTNEQMKWLYSERFPATEVLFNRNWIHNPKATKLFRIAAAPADLSFEVFWSLYNYKVKREKAEQAWNKLPEADRIKCFNNLKAYEAHIKLTGQGKAHLVTWINQKRYNDEY